MLCCLAAPLCIDMQYLEQHVLPASPTGGWGAVPTGTSTRLFGNAFSLVPYMQVCIQAVELRSSGREPYAYRFARTHMAAELQRRFPGPARWRGG